MGKFKNVDIALHNYFDGKMPSVEQVDNELENLENENDRKYLEVLKDMASESQDGECGSSQ